MTVIQQIELFAQEALADLSQHKIEKGDILISETKPEFEGDYTIVLFSFVKELKKSPEILGKELGDILVQQYAQFFSSYNVIKGFLNLSVADNVWADFLHQNFNNENFGKKEKNGKKVMVEYSSPNTNKPLHLGHLRNNFLGWSIGEIYKINGYDIIKTCIANDRGIHICKSMIAWQLFAKGATPQSTGIKGDHFVGDYYVLFNVAYKNQIEEIKSGGVSEEDAEKLAPIMNDAKQMLVDWEAGKPDVIELWKTMNNWVYAGFDETYKRIGTDFDKVYYESNTYILGKELVKTGLARHIFFEKEDRSIWIDLTNDGLDEKIVQRKDGTAVYITQDIGLAIKKWEEYNPDISIYVVGDEQNYHFKVLKLICQKLAIPSADNIFHLSYGMVELPTGRMKTREGSVVDADDMLDEMHLEASKKTKEQGKTEGFSETELHELYETLGVGGLKFFLLRVDPKKRMLFNPEESIDLHGYTATFVQYAYARIRSIFRKESILNGESPMVNQEPSSEFRTLSSLLPLEKELIVIIEKFPGMLSQACAEMNPSVMANYVYNVAKTFNSFYAEHSVSNAENEEKKILRLQLCNLTAITIRKTMALLGIRVPERM
ncbi:MAG TPA: arginine--tRNA ligase [Puia sp.]|nr:arginine--tRNA ligase [Puia sp.]